jgi:hypothetical protein
MTSALRRLTHASLLLWWAPSIVVLLARPALTRASFSYRTKRAERLLDAGDITEADRVIARLRCEAERYQRRVEARFGCSEDRTRRST